jgi:ribosome-associated protein
LSNKLNPTRTILDAIIEKALEKKASDLIVLNVKSLTSITDYFLICSASTEPQIKAICDNIRKGTPHKPFHIEGYEKLSWVLLDYIDIIVHVFKTEERKYYNIEKLWADAPKKEYND